MSLTSSLHIPSEQAPDTSVSSIIIASTMLFHAWSSLIASTAIFFYVLSRTSVRWEVFEAVVNVARRRMLWIKPKAPSVWLVSNLRAT